MKTSLIIVAILVCAIPSHAQITLAIGQPDTAATTSSNAQVWPGCASNCLSANPAYVVIPGSTRKVWTNVCSGTNAWGGSGFPTEVANCTYPASIAVTWVVSSGHCTMSPSPSTVFSTLICPSSISATELNTITATTVQTPTASVTFHVLVVKPAADVLGPSASMALHTCGAETGTATCVNVLPFYEVLYRGQYAALQAYVKGTVNTAVTWGVSPSNGGLTITNGSANRSIGLLAVNAGTYTVTATSVADGTALGTAKIIVTANSIVGQTRTSKVTPIDCTAEGSGTTYEVTDATTYGAVPWTTLAAGDTVRIHAGTYAIPFEIYTSGTATQPIRICGVPDGSGNLPVITGVNAGPGNVSSAEQPYGLIVLRVNAFQHVNCSLGAGCSQPPEPDPHHIIIEGLKITSAYTAYSRAGGAAAWDPAAGCTRIQARDVVIRGNECTDSGNGIYTQSQADLRETEIVRRLTVEGNYIYNNGTIGGFSQHNNYLQGDELLYQWNWVGVVRSGSGGGSLKVRMPYAVIRYNYVQGSARLLDKVEIQDWGDYALPNYYYADNWPTSNIADPISIADIAVVAEHMQTGDYVYGNVMDNNALLGNSATFPIHYFTDVFGPNTEFGGTLYFYNNTFRNRQDASGTFGNGINMLDQARSSGAFPSVWPQARLTNNAIDIECATVGCGNGFPSFSFAVAYQDIDTLDKNWITTGWNTTPLGSGPSPAWSLCCASPSNNGANCYQGTCTDINAGNHITGAASLVTGVTTPFNGTTFVPIASSPLLSAAVSLPSDAADMPPEFNYQPDTQTISARADIVTNAPTTIGAIAVTGSPETPPVNTPAAPGTGSVGGVKLSGGAAMSN